jgi:site-specific recombinase XerC
MENVALERRLRGALLASTPPSNFVVLLDKLLPGSLRGKRSAEIEQLRQDLLRWIEFLGVLRNQSESLCAAPGNQSQVEETVVTWLKEATAECYQWYRRWVFLQDLGEAREDQRILAVSICYAADMLHDVSAPLKSLPGEYLMATGRVPLLGYFSPIVSSRRRFATLCSILNIESYLDVRFNQKSRKLHGGQQISSFLRWLGRRYDVRIPASGPGQDTEQSLAVVLGKLTADDMIGYAKWLLSPRQRLSRRASMVHMLGVLAWVKHQTQCGVCPPSALDRVRSLAEADFPASRSPNGIEVARERPIFPFELPLLSKFFEEQKIAGRAIDEPRTFIWEFYWWLVSRKRIQIHPFPTLAELQIFEDQICKVEDSDLAAYRAHVVATKPGSGYSKAQRRVSWVKRFYCWLCQTGRISKDPAAGLALPSPAELGRRVTFEEVVRLKRLAGYPKWEVIRGFADYLQKELRYSTTDLRPLWNFLKWWAKEKQIPLSSRSSEEDLRRLGSSLSRISREDLVRYRATLLIVKKLGEGVISTRRRRWTLTRLFCEYLLGRGYLTVNPSSEIAALRRSEFIVN